MLHFNIKVVLTPTFSSLPDNKAYKTLDTTLSFQRIIEGFPGGSVVENPPANAGHTGSIPGPEIPHMLGSN